MKAVVYDRYGSPDVLDIQEVAKPTVSDRGVLIRVRASGVNATYPHFFVTAIDFSGNESGPAIPAPPTGIGDAPLPQTPTLSSHPNPFNPTTTITFTVASAGPVTLAVYDVNGGLIETLLDQEYRTPDTYQMQFRPPNASGVYFARLATGGQTRSIKLVLLK